MNDTTISHRFNGQRRGNAYTTALLGLIVTIMLTLIFGVIAWLKYDEQQLATVGDDEVEPGSVENSLESHRREIAALEKTIAARRDEVRKREAAIHRRDVELAARGVNYDDTLEAFTTDDLTTRRQQMQEKVTLTLEIMQAHREAMEGVQNSMFIPMEDLIDRLQTDTQKVLQEITDMDARLEVDKEALHTKLDKLEAEKEANKKDYGDQFSTLSTSITQADDRIRQLLELELDWLDELLPDGRVVSTDASRRYIVINLGSEDRVYNGLIFEIFQYVKGRMISKGICEVISTEPSISTCRVVQEHHPKHNPIAKDDMIGNPIFSTERPYVFVLAGDFRHFNKANLADFIRRTGGEVRDRLEPGVDYLVAGEGTQSYEAQDKAREFHITAMTEEQLIKYLQTTFEFEDPMAAAP